MQHDQPFLEYSEEDLEVASPKAGDFRPGDLVILSSLVRWLTHKQTSNLITASRQVGKTQTVRESLNFLLEAPEWDEVGIVIGAYRDGAWIKVNWCRHSRARHHKVIELSIVRRA